MYPIRRSGHASHLPAKAIKTMEMHHDSLVDGIDVHIGGWVWGVANSVKMSRCIVSGPLDANRCFLISATAS